MDKLIKATAGEGTVRILAAETKHLVNRGMELHGLTPTGAALLGRMLTMGVMMGSMLKNPADLLTIQMNGKGPAAGCLVTAGGNLKVKGYVGNPEVDLPRKANGKLDVAGAMGTDGGLTVIMDMGLKEPYVSSTPIQTGEIAEDFAYYYTVSEQTPSAVALGVMIDPDLTVGQAGGFIIQMMPGHSPETADLLSDALEKLPTLTNLLSEGKSMEDILRIIFAGLNLKINEIHEPEYFCDCSREKVEKVLISIGLKDLTELYEDGTTESLTCHFCNKHYDFTHEEIGKLLAEAR